MTDLPGTLQDESTVVEENSQLLNRILSRLVTIDCLNYYFQSSSPSPQSPMTDLPGTLQDESTMVEENSQLLSRIAELQQEKWNLEEKVGVS